MPIERGLDPHINHTSENSENYIRFSAYSGYDEYEKEQPEYSYFALEKVFGSRKAHFINKLNYWLSRCGRNINGLSGKWIYNPTHEWSNQLNCSISTIKRLIKSLEEHSNNKPKTDIVINTTYSKLLCKGSSINDTLIIIKNVIEVRQIVNFVINAK